MLRLLKLKAFKAICLVTRRLLRRAYFNAQLEHKTSLKYRIATNLYCWSELHICYTLHHTYILPGFLFRLMAIVLTYAASKNVTSLNPPLVHSRALGELVEKLIHKIPDKFRYPKMSVLNAPVIGQGDKCLNPKREGV